MSLLSLPQALLASAVVTALLVVLFLLRRKARRVVVPSLMPFRKVVRRRVNPLWRALIALALQILGSLLCIWSLLAPPQDTAETPEIPQVWVVDTSASMAGRLPALDAQVLGQPVGLMAAGEETRLIFGPGSSRAQQAAGLAHLGPSGSGADLAGAVQLAQSMGAEVLVLTDHDPELGVPWRVLGPAQGADVSLQSLSATAGPGLPPEIQLSLTLQNHGTEPVELQLRLETASSVVGEDRFTLEPGAPVIKGYKMDPVADGSPWIQATLVNHSDALSANDVAFGLLPPVRPARVWIVGDAPNRYLEGGFGVMPGVQVERVRAGAYRDPGDSVDLVVFDRVVPRVLPQVPALYVDPPMGAGPFPPVQAAQDPEFTSWDFSHPLLDGVALRHLEVERLHLLKGGPGDRMLAGAAEGPVALVRDDAPRAVALGFDLTRSDWPLSVAFPQFLYRLLIWARQGSDLDRAPAVDAWEGVPLDPGAPARVQRLDQPGQWEVQAGTQRLRGLPAGVYEVDQGEQPRQIAVNLPAAEFASALAGDPLPAAPEPAAPSDSRPRWVWLALGAAVVLLVEFGVSER